MLFLPSYFVLKLNIKRERALPFYVIHIYALYSPISYLLSPISYLRSILNVYSYTQNK